MNLFEDEINFQIVDIWLKGAVPRRVRGI